MMTPTELDACLAALRLAQVEAADLLDISPRTMRRWFEGEAIPGPAEAALRAWMKLEQNYLPWRPDAVSILTRDQEQYALMRQHDIEQASMLSKVESRGGPRLPWTVNIAKGQATLGPAIVSFYHLSNGGFAVSSYRRTDQQHPDVDEDRETIEDAVFCIAATYKKFGERAYALRAVAEHVRSKSSLFGVSGTRQLNDSERLERQRQIESHAARILQMADGSHQGKATTYQDFSAILNQLTGLGYCPPDSALVDAVARSYVEHRSRRATSSISSTKSR